MTVFIRRAPGASTLRRGRALRALPSLAVAAFALFAPVTEAEAAFRQSPNGRIVLDLGAAFAPTDRFSGFVDKGTGASFAIIDLPAAAYDKLKAIPESKEALAREGFSGTEKAELKGRKGNFVYLTGKQNTPAGDVTKFVLIFTESDVAGVIVVNVPQAAIDAGTYSREGIEATLAGATVRDLPDGPTDLFNFGYLGPFRQAFDHGGLTRAYNLSGAKPSESENQLVKEAMLMVSSSIHGDAIDVKAQADKAFMELGGMTDRRVDDRKEVKVGDFGGYQISGEVTDSASAKKIAVRLVLLSAGPAGYFMFVGSAPVADKEAMMPEVEKVIASFYLVK